MNDSSSTTASKTPFRVLITGRAGSGKSSISAELMRRGLPAFDADSVPGLSAWFDTYKNKAVTIDAKNYVDISRFEWRWSPEVLKEFISEHPILFLCGGADNDFDFEDVFDMHFVLKVSPSLQVKRLLERTNSSYGKNPAMHNAIIKESAKHIQAAAKLGLEIIDADTDIDTVVDEILEKIR
jgi:dephospho-CoA kinase